VPRQRIADPRPDPRLRFDPPSLGLSLPTRNFFLRDTRLVARDLLSCWIGRRWRGGWYGGRIVETEAYLGPLDRAAHSFGARRTRRVEPMYAEGGHLYVFLVYGMHHCANVVTRRAGVPEAVLLRAAEASGGATRTMAGPARLCAALGITGADSGGDLLSGGKVAIWKPRRARRPAISVTARIGVDYAGEAAAWPLRFFDADSASVSVRTRRTRVSG
jgi:DNA-3-methyladenine glycosylase